MTLGKFLREIREDRHLRRIDAAAEAECSQEHIRNIEKETARPSPEMLNRFFEVYDCDEETRSRGWVLLARAHIPPEVGRRVDVYRSGIADRVAESVLEWVSDYYEIGDELEDDKVYLSFQIQTVMEKP